jgi:hypothetical protein
MKKEKNTKMRSVKILNEDDEVVESTETYPDNVISATEYDVKEELQDFDGYREALRDKQSQYNGNDI